MSHSIGLFKNYLLTKTKHNIGKTNEEEFDDVKGVPPRPLLPPKFGNGSRPPSLLEQAILPSIKSNEVLPTLCGEESSKAQLTIFYAGTINAYDDVPPEKVQAIMLLAGESSLKDPLVKSIPEMDIAKQLQRSKLPSICKFQAGLPIARKYSLQRFLEKRRDRITNKSPYAPPSTSKQGEVKDDESSSNEQRSFSPFPFPSRSGSFSLLSANKGH